MRINLIAPLHVAEVKNGASSEQIVLVYQLKTYLLRNVVSPTLVCVRVLQYSLFG